MPAKGKKPARPLPDAAAGDRSSLPRKPFSPAREPSVSGAGDDEALHRRLLSEAAARFPALISEAALYGRVSESESSPSNGNQARVWLSEAAMVSSSLAPGSLVSVSLAASVKEPFNGFPLENLVEDCSRHFGYDIGNHMTDGAGNYFAIATVFPSRKVSKNDVRLSWGLSCTLGFPPTGKATFVCSIGSLTTSHSQNRNDGINHGKLCKCKDLYLNLVPQTAGLMVFGKGSSTSDAIAESACAPTGNGKVTSPKTPKLSSPADTPLRSTKSLDFVSIADSSMSLDVSAVRSALEDEKVNELLQIYAARWLSGRHLLVGNLVTVPVCGQFYVFLVLGMEKLQMGCSNQDLTSGEYVPLPRDIQMPNSPDEVNAPFLVDTRTVVHLSDSMHLEEQTANKEAGVVPRLGGLDKEFAKLKEIFQCTMSSNFDYVRIKGVLLHGPPGTGKTSMVRYFAHDAGASLLSINGPEIISQYYGETEQALCAIFDSARQAAPAVVFIDELDTIAPARKEGGEELSGRMVLTLLKLMDEINEDDRILVIAATNRPDSIDPGLRRPGRLEEEIEIGVPSPEQRLDILGTLLSEMDHSLSSSEIQTLALETHGFVGVDLDALCNEAAMTSLRRYIKLKYADFHIKELVSSRDGHAADIQDPYVHKIEDGSCLDEVDSLSSSLAELVVSKHVASEVKEETLLKVIAEDFEKAKMRVRPSAMREVMLELPKVRWEDVGGQNTGKKELIETVQWPQLKPNPYERLGISPPSGLLMIGPPGCSKTLMARAVAFEAKMNFLAVKGPELFRKWVGESEKAVRSLFAKAKTNSPAIIFFDEIDALAVTRGKENDGTSVDDRVLSQLLVEMDGLDPRTGVIVIAATNRPDKIDHALLRPGRFDRMLDVLPPDEIDREDIFRIHMRKMPCSSDVSTKVLAQLTEGYTGADIQSICRQAGLAALQESFEISEVSMAHFKIGISQVQPTDVKFYVELAEKFQRRVPSCKSVREGKPAPLSNFTALASPFEGGMQKSEGNLDRDNPS